MGSNRSLRARVERLLLSRTSGVTHPYGESSEDIRRRVADQPRRIAARAVELREELYDRGGWLEAELRQLTGEELEAHIVAVAGVEGWGAVPAEWLEDRYPPLPEELAAELERVADELPPLTPEEAAARDPLAWFRSMYTQRTEGRE